MTDQTPSNPPSASTKASASTRLKNMFRPSLTGIKNSIRSHSRTAGKDSAPGSKNQQSSGGTQTADPFPRREEREDRTASKPKSDPWGGSRSSMHSQAHVGPGDGHSDRGSKFSHTVFEPVDPDAITQLPPKTPYPAQSQR